MSKFKVGDKVVAWPCTGNEINGTVVECGKSAHYANYVRINYDDGSGLGLVNERDVELRPNESAEPTRTLLDEFAMAALTGILAHPDISSVPDNIARASYVVAHAMMKEREND